MSRPFRFRLLFSLILFVTGLIILDACLDERRDFYPDYSYLPPYDIVINRPNLFRIARAKRLNQRTNKNETYNYSIFIDADGSRCDPNSAPCSPEIPVLAIVGDSFSFGLHAEYKETWAGLLQTAFPHCKVFNFAVTATCSRDYPLTLKYFLSKKSPIKLKALLVGLYVDPVDGDIPRVLARSRFGSYKEIDGYYVGPSQYLRVTDSSWTRVLYTCELFLRTHTSLLNLLWPRPPAKEFSAPVSEPLPALVATQIFDTEMANLESLREVSGLPASAIVVQLIPSSEDTLAIFKARANQEPYPWPTTRALWDRIRDEARRRGYQLVDNRELIVNRASLPGYANDDSQPVPVAWDGHLTNTGFEWLGQTLKEPLGRILTR